MTREQFIDEIHDNIALLIDDDGKLEPDKVAKVIEYRLQWLFDNYTFIKKD